MRHHMYHVWVTIGHHLSYGSLPILGNIYFLFWHWPFPREREKMNLWVVGGTSFSNGDLLGNLHIGCLLKGMDTPSIHILLKNHHMGNINELEAAIFYIFLSSGPEMRTCLEMINIFLSYQYFHKNTPHGTYLRLNPISSWDVLGWR